MEFKGLIITSLLIGLYIFAIISFGISLSGSNNPNSTIMQNEVINRSYSNLESELEGLQDKAEDSRESFLSEIPVFGEIITVFKSIFGIGSAFITITRNLYNIVIELISTGLGVGSGTGKIIFGVFTSIIILVSILLAWSLYKAGK